MGRYRCSREESKVWIRLRSRNVAFTTDLHRLCLLLESKKGRRADSFGLDINHCDVIQFFNIYFIWLKTFSHE